MSALHACCALLLSAVAVLLPSQVRAETFHTCRGFITSLPATITTQGVWCLRQDLSTAITDGSAITIATNNVTIDCNGFKLGGLPAGAASQANGIHAYNRQNAGVRNCGIRGFFRGIFFHYGAGHTIEDNRLDNNLAYGIALWFTENSAIRRNRVFDTGGATGFAMAIGIESAGADLVGNVVSGAFATGDSAVVYGMTARGVGLRIQDNIVRRLASSVAGAGAVTGIYAENRGRIARNQVVIGPARSGRAIVGHYDGSSHCADNQAGGLSQGFVDCLLLGGNTAF